MGFRVGVALARVSVYTAWLEELAIFTGSVCFAKLVGLCRYIRCTINIASALSSNKSSLYPYMGHIHRNEDNIYGASKELRYWEKITK